jgi:CRP-like cAMP-binding protein
VAATPINPEGLARGNRLLGALPEAAWARLRPELEIVQLRLREPFHEAGRPIRHVHFPITGVASMVATLQEGGGVVEVAMIGNEGLVGLPALLGARTSPMTTFLQIPGPTARLPAAALRAEVARGGSWVALLHRYTHAFLVQLAQTAACNARHPLEERLARWLLTTRDRAGDEFPITHGVMGQMLGVRRAGVTEALQALQRAGAVAHQRGRMRIVDRVVLEGASCACYRIIRDEYRKMLEGA